MVSAWYGLAVARLPSLIYRRIHENASVCGAVEKNPTQRLSVAGTLHQQNDFDAPAKSLRVRGFSQRTKPKNKWKESMSATSKTKSGGLAAFNATKCSSSPKSVNGRILEPTLQKKAGHLNQAQREELAKAFSRWAEQLTGEASTPPTKTAEIRRGAQQEMVDFLSKVCWAITMTEEVLKLDFEYLKIPGDC